MVTVVATLSLRDPVIPIECPEVPDSRGLIRIEVSEPVEGVVPLRGCSIPMRPRPISTSRATGAAMSTIGRDKGDASPGALRVERAGSSMSIPKRGGHPAGR